MADTIRKETGLDSELVRGSGGIFVVSADNKRLFSKKEAGRFPTEREIVEQIKAMQ